jgi:hypothetical protein
MSLLAGAISGLFFVGVALVRPLNGSNQKLLQTPLPLQLQAEGFPESGTVSRVV